MAVMAVVERVTEMEMEMEKAAMAMAMARVMEMEKAAETRAVLVRAPVLALAKMAVTTGAVVTTMTSPVLVAVALSRGDTAVDSSDPTWSVSGT